MNDLKPLWFLLLIMFTHDALALSNGECTFTNQSLMYSGVNIPSLNTEYKDGEVLGQLTLKANYSCKTYHVTNVGGNAGVVLQIGTLGARHSYLGNNQYKSNVSGIIFEATNVQVKQVAGYNNELHLMSFSKPSYSNQQNISGVINTPIFSVIKTGEISNTTSVSLNLERAMNLTSHLYDSGDGYGIFTSSTNVPDTAAIPVYNASCSITHPTNVDVPALIPGVRAEVSSQFNVVLNCASKEVMKNNIQLTVNPVMTAGVSVSQDKSSLLYNSGGRVILMNLFNSVSTETQMHFSTMYQFSNSSQSSSFTIPMRANFILASTTYGNFSFQTQLSVRYN